MYIARVRIELKDDYEERYYEKDKWFDLFEYKDKKCIWRIKEDGVIDFIIGNYKDRFDALEDGKMLYFSILYEVHRSDFRFDLGESKYITRMYHEDRGYSAEEFIENEEWFFNTKKDSADYLGLNIYEIDKGIEEYDEYEKIIIGGLTVITEEPFSFLEKIKKIDKNYKYSKETQEIFNLVRLSELADRKTKILLLCQALETMGSNENRTKEELEVLDKCIKYIEESDLESDKKENLENMLRQSKNISSKNKCKKLIDKYCLYEYKQFSKKKVFDKAYMLRGKIIHGEKINEDTDFGCAHYLKVMVLDILKEWSKDSKKTYIRDVYNN